MKQFIITIMAVIFFSSCKKETSMSSQQLPSVVSNSTVNNTTASNSTSQGETIVRIDLTGQTVVDPCTGQTLTILSGDLINNIAPDGISVRLSQIHNFVLQAADGTITSTHFVSTFELIGSGGFINTYKIISHSQDNGTHLVLQGQFKVTNFTVQFDKFFLKCF